MRAMHRWLLLVMIALLPLRGWVAEAMAGEMLEQRVAMAAVQDVAAHQPAHDCMGHDTGTAQPAGEQAAHGADCPTCASCQVCSAVALGFAAQPQAAVGYSQPRPHSPDRAHRSAERAQAFKPPIS
jgi:hypothetical protein